MEVYFSSQLTLNFPSLFEREDFQKWLNSTAKVLTWHEKGTTPSEFSDVVVLVDPSLNGEGSDSDMPGWDLIMDVCRKHLPLNCNSMHYMVRITNLKY